jgi:hypothetical protein
MIILKKVYLAYLHVPEEYDDYRDDRVLEVPHRDIQVAYREGYYGYLFYDVWYAQIEVEGEMVEFKAEPTNHSAVHYYGIRLMSIRDMYMLKWRKAPSRERREIRRYWDMNNIKCFIVPLGSYGYDFVPMRQSPGSFHFKIVSRETEKPDESSE